MSGYYTILCTYKRTIQTGLRQPAWAKRHKCSFSSSTLLLLYCAHCTDLVGVFTAWAPRTQICDTWLFLDHFCMYLHVFFITWLFVSQVWVTNSGLTHFACHCAETKSWCQTQLVDALHLYNNLFTHLTAFVLAGCIVALPHVTTEIPPDY